MARHGFGFALWAAVLGFAVMASGEEPAAPDAPDETAVLMEQLLAADRAWAETPPDPEAFASFFAAGGRLFPPGAPLAEGQDAILDLMRPLFASPGYALEWQATAADVAASGDLGFTFGTFEQKGQDEAGLPTLVIGKYVTVWRRGDDRTWRVVADIFNAD